MLMIADNLLAANAARHLGQSYNSLAQSTARLSSGLRINSAKDDAAGMAVSELLKADVATLDQGSRNSNDAVSMLQTAEGAMGVDDQILVRMKELAEQASTASYSSAQRKIMNNEYVQLGNEIDRIAASTSFNGIQLLNSSATYKINVGSTDTINLTAQKMTQSKLGVEVGLGRQESQDNTRGVANASDTYVNAAEVNNTTKRYVTFKFGASAWASADVAVDLSAYAGVGISLNNLVDKINAAWTTKFAGTARAGTVAYATFDSNTQQYRLQLVNPQAGVAAFHASGTNTIGIVSANSKFTEAVSGSAGTALTLNTTSGAVQALAALTSAIKAKDAYRAELGYMMNRLDDASQVISIQSENLKAACSSITDVDVATEMANMTRNQVLAQAGVAMLSQANTIPQMALQLLKG